MKNLDLNNYGVQEMNAGQMNAIDGGFMLFGGNWWMLYRAAGPGWGWGNGPGGDGPYA